jgi:hypothetical protein
MTKDDMFQNGFGDSQQERNFSIQFTTFVTERLSIAFLIDCPQYTIQLLEGHGGFLLLNFHGSYHDHGISGSIGKTELNVGLDDRLTNATRVMNEGLARFVSWWHGTTDGEFETFNNGSSGQGGRS